MKDKSSTTITPQHFVSYCRSAVFDEDSQQAMDAQKKVNEEYVLNRGGMVNKIYEDHGYGGMDLDRPAFKELLADAKKGLFEIVVVTRLDHLGRGPAGFEAYKHLKVAGVLLEVSQEDIDAHSTIVFQDFISDIAAKRLYERRNRR